MNEIEIISPVDGRVYHRLSMMSKSEVHETINNAQVAQRDWSRRALEDRISICQRFIEAFKEDVDRISEELTWQMGRPISYSSKEVSGLVERCEAMIASAPAGLKSIEISGAPNERRIDRVPHGVALVIAPWNYPYLTAVNTIVPALLAGNAVILKPALQTALTGDRFADAFTKAGLPEGLFTSLMISHEDIAGLLYEREVDFVSFTGSVRAGVEIERAAAGSFLPISLELGGKDPAYVRADANIENAVQQLVDGAFFNSGQSCCGIERIYVNQSIFTEFVDRFGEITNETQKLGDPTNCDTTLGPVVSCHAAKTIRSQINTAISQGARTLCCEKKNTFDIPYLKATILVDVDHSMDVMIEETFGPVVGIMPVDNDEMAIQLMNDSKYGLSASIWTDDIEAGGIIGQKIETGTVFINRCDYLDPDLAWVGIKNSGRGCSLSELGFHQVTRPNSYSIQRQ